MTNPKVFMDIKIAGAPAGRIVFELFADVTPITAENFRALCTGEKGIGKITGKPLHYKGLCFDNNYRRDYILFEGNGESIYGGNFERENFLNKHADAGILSMGLSLSFDKKQNSRFFITVNAASEYDGICVVVGKVISGMDVVHAIHSVRKGAINGVSIADCGQLNDDEDDEDVEPY